MKASTLFIFLLLNACCHAQTFSAGNPMVLTNITEQNGLSDNHVESVLKDRNGFVWVGTADGLNLMDGSTIKVFKHTVDSNSIANNDIQSIKEDKDGNIWCGTQGGLCCYNRKLGTFSNFGPPLSPYGASNIIGAVVIDAQSRVWCATDGGLYVFYPEQKKFKPYYNLTGDDPANVTYRNKLHYMMADSQQKLWLCTGDGIWSFDPSTFLYKNQIHKDNDPQYKGLFLYVFEDHLHNIWAGNWQYGLKKLDRATGHVTDYSSLPRSPGLVNCISEVRQPDGKYVIWLNGDLLAFDPEANQFFQYPKPLQAAESPNVSPTFESDDGWVWLASDKGLFIYSPQRQVFRHAFFPIPLTTQGIVFLEKNKSLFMGAQGESLLREYDSSGRLIKNYSRILSSHNSSGNIAAALALATKDDNDLWLANSEGIARLNLSTLQKKWFNHNAKDSTTMPRNFIAYIFFDSKKQLWIFPWREGIWQMDTETGKCKRLLDGFINEPGHVKGLLIADAVEDKNGNIWMADLDEGIVLYDAKTKLFSKPFRSEIGERNHVDRIFYKDGYCYATTPNAICKWDTEIRKLQIFTPPAEINKQLYSMVPDQKGNWWITSKNGLIFFNEKLNLFKRYTTSDGLVSNDINGTLFCRHDGTMLLGMPEYITSFNPEDITRGTLKDDRISLTGIQVNEKPIDWDSTSLLNLDYRSSNIEFKWALPDYVNPLKNQYFYKLTGIDTGWRYAGNNGEVRFANLTYGKYNIVLKAATSNGSASANTININFTINPPFWKTRWFLLLLILSISALFFSVVRYISQRNLKEKLLLLEKEQAVEKERNRISRDMHDDLGSGLTKIAIMSEVVKKQIHEPEKAKHQLENISISSRELVDNLQDIIWILNPKNDTLESLAAYIREYAVKFFEPFGIDVQFIYPEKFTNTRLSEETRRNIFLTLKETFNNIAKHADSDKVLVKMERKISSVLLQIQDNGKGFDINNTRAFGNGLINMKNRIEQVGGTYNLISEQNKGTTMTLEVPANTFL